MSTTDRSTARARNRLIFLGALALMATMGLAARLWELTVVDGAEFREEAEKRLAQTALKETVRGSILDRLGRVIAKDVPVWEVAIDYGVIDGSWVRDRAKRTARKVYGRSLWGRLSHDARDSTIELCLMREEEARNEMLDQVALYCDIPRAQIDEKIEIIRAQVQKRADVIWAKQREALTAKLGHDPGDTFHPQPIYEQKSSHVIARQVSETAAFALRKVGDLFPNSVRVIDSMLRVRPWESADVSLSQKTLPKPIRKAGEANIHVLGVFDHVLGTIREETWAEDLERRPFVKSDGTIDLGGYRPGPDLVGGRGLEASYEDWLRGIRGQKETRLETGQIKEVESIWGRDLKLTIDIELQAHVQAILNPEFGLTKVQEWHHSGGDGLPLGMPLASAAVIVEVESGEILALGSWPTLADAAGMSASDLFRLQPGVNRASEAVYPPGSIVKPLVYVGAVGAGKFSLAGAVECKGHYFPEFKDRARCWIYRPQFSMTNHSAQTGGPLTVESATSRSCNIFFYTVAHKFGLRPLVDWYKSLGVGMTLGTGLQGPLPAAQRGVGGESIGMIPNEEQMLNIEARHDVFTPIIMGIGQGPIAWTPLQAANAFATLARGGKILDAHIIQDAAALPPDRRTGHLDMPAEACRRALEGLRQAVEDKHGTGHHIKYGDGSQEPIISIPGITIYGKTGTAQAPPLPMDDNGDGKSDRSVKGIDHAWFVGLAAKKGAKPKYAIAVLVERGGSGGKAAGPIAGQIIRALLDDEYFSDENNAEITNKGAEIEQFSPSQDPQPPEPEASEGEVAP
ncbi:MAG: hypothetical protein EXS12_02120 [Phycisphaerales bacterium]|nr:hypothetical protein [Phycisphaerales bacterium]